MYDFPPHPNHTPAVQAAANGFKSESNHATGSMQVVMLSPADHFTYPRCGSLTTNRYDESARRSARAAGWNTWQLLIAAIMMIVCPAAVAGQAGVYRYPGFSAKARTS